MKDVKFLPWEGENYQKGGFNGKKILVIGESFYCSEEEAVATLTTNIVEDYLAIRKGEYRKNNGGWTNTYLKFERSLKGKETNPEESRIIWNSIAFYNYLQVPMSGARESGSPIDYKNAEKAFFEVLNKLQPDLIIVWGVRLFQKLPGIKEGWIGCDLLEFDWDNGQNKKINNGYYQLKNGKKSRVVAIYHPSVGYSWDKWHKVIKSQL
jgi:hypothetical protein